QDYATAGWHEIGAANGDLNRDGIDDVAVVIEAPEGMMEPRNACDGDQGYSEAPVRRLIVAFADGKGGYTRAADEPRLVLRSDEGGAFGDPFEGISIERGSIVADHYGGSRWRWGMTVRFRFDDGDWRMTGMTDSQMDSLSLSAITYDYNALSGKVEVAVEGPEPDAEPGEPLCTACRVGEQCPEANGCYQGTRITKAGKVLYTVGKKDRIVMSQFRCWFDKVGLLTHTGFQASF
ncbi:MAG: hypothetical protein WAU86_02005, partial [Oricola sp.]